MKRLLSILSLLCLAALLPLRALAWETAVDPLLLTGSFSDYWFEPQCSLGVVDEDGVLWRYEGLLEPGRDLYSALQGLAAQGKLTRVGELSHDELFDLKSLVCAVDAGALVIGEDYIDDGDVTERYAFRVNVSDEGVPDIETILLGMADAELAENTSPAAQALYKRLATLFPDIRYADYGPEYAPKGFQPVPLAEFCGLSGLDAEGITVHAYDADCEVGLTEIPLTEKEQQSWLTLPHRALVTGMANATQVTGGTTVIVFETADGTHLGSLEFYQGLLCTNDGMYFLETQE